MEVLFTISKLNVSKKHLWERVKRVRIDFTQHEKSTKSLYNPFGKKLKRKARIKRIISELGREHDSTDRPMEINNIQLKSWLYVLMKTHLFLNTKSSTYLHVIHRTEIQ